MQIVIDIHEKDYQSMKNGHIPYSVISTIMNGTPLLKGHGDLIDINELTTVTEIRPDGSEITYVPYSEIEEANVIVKADKENADERNSD